MHNAFYLKYRPQSLEELIGQEAVKKNLLLSFQNNKLSHAYLFVGPRGTGKTSTARILAKMVNCENNQNVILEEAQRPIESKEDAIASLQHDIKTDVVGIPCNKCSTCISITDGSNMDLIEIDAASNRGIEDIRSLRDKIKLAPTSSKKKVYIIDEVHMLTTEAFNALLKTLEEPPQHALFILATTEGAKIPQTILSRVQRLDFKLAKPAELMEALTKIIKAEKIDIKDEELKFLVRKAAGSFRDGVKLLDQISSTGGKITTEQSEDLLGLLENLVEKNAGISLLKTLKLMEQGSDAKELILSLMETLRNLVFIKNGLGDALVAPQFTEDRYGELVKLSEKFASQDLIKDLNILQEAFEKLKFASIQSLPLELAIVEICGSSNVVIVSEPEQSIKEEVPVAIAKNDDIVPVSQVSDSPDILKLKEKWTFVLETIRPFNFSLEALLRSIKIAECTQSLVIMEVPYSFHQRILEAPKNKDLLESILSDILGRSIRISIALGVRPARIEDIANVDVAADDEIIRAAAEIFNSDTVN